jgi:fructose-bisphosphate aldolase class II
MPLKSTAEIVADARRRGHGAGAFNVITLEHAEAAVAGAEAVRCPVILQVSQNAVRFHGGRLRPIAAAVAELAACAAVPVGLHLDHVEDEALLSEAPDAGFSSVMFDGSRLDDAANRDATAAAVRWAHAHGLWLEAELGEIGGKDGAHAPGVRTDPDDAAAFVADTGIDALAVAVGSSHAMTSRTAGLDHALIARLRGRLPVPLVLHGSSGVSDEELGRAVAAGMTKINVGTILNVAYTATLRRELADDEQLVDPRRYLAPARTAIAEVVARTLRALHAGDVTAPAPTAPAGSQL